jgi:hypothetical protein
MSPASAPNYEALRQRFIACLEGAARAHEIGDLPAISMGYDHLDAELPRNAGPDFDKLHVALEFWDGWIDARNHEWLYYPGVAAGDWPRLARAIADDLKQDRDITDKRVLERFDFRRRAGRHSLWARLKDMFGVAGAV